MPDIVPLHPGDPSRLGDYELAGRLGQGGQGIVYLGKSDTGELAAVKLMHVRLAGDEASRARFRRELAAAKRVAPFCTARVLDFDIEGDAPYIASEYIDASSLREVVETSGPLSGTPLDRLAIGTATALTAIHHAGIVHRDFKPDNVLLAPDGPRVVDFGIARMLDGTGTLTSQAIGTPAYMAPEQISNLPVSTATDVFAWASTIVFAATGAPPFGANSIAAVLNGILNLEPDLGALSGPLREVIADCLSKRPEDRPKTDEILLRLLHRPPAPAVSEEVLSEGAEAATPTLMKPVPAATRPSGEPPAPAAPVPATPAPAKTPPDGRRRRSRARWYAAAAAALVLAGGGGLWASQNIGGGPPATSGPTAKPQPPRAETLAEKIAGGDTITVGVREDLPGLSLLGGGPMGYAGLEVDVALELLKRMGVPADRVRFESVGIARESALESGAVDLVLATYSINQARRNKVTFAGPYLVAHQDVMVRADDRVKRLADLNGKRLCAPAGSLGVARARQRSPKLVPVDAANLSDCTRMLRDGRVDAIVNDDMILAGFGVQAGGGFRILGERLSDERYGVGLRLGDKRSCLLVNKAVQGIYREGTMRVLFKRHLGGMGFTPGLGLPKPESCG
ncbi:serine/threonine-protein kinase [Bailinhaonella thermotolerans]|uniref:Protein kinase domain-containing protein n=1 Tax=Bailinhaonella thermotolerans TaxID=1070861 RepID=A0A3A4A562_9ACTN|nr:serine/threonine-protein kinase [Bailinhaonella thermotolerans]RJL23655.1 hypothetical protein D5H75_32690 [Bailinhaonella thermotolerans]